MLVEAFGWDNPVGKVVYQNDTIKYTIVGVVREEGRHPEPWLLIPRVRPADGSAMDNMIKAEVGQGVAHVNLLELSKVGAVVNNHKATIPDFTKFYDVTIMNPRVLVGAFMGVMLAFVFCAMTMKAVGRAAGKMVEEVRRQFREIPGIMEGTGEPEYASCVAISTAAAQREMMLPSLLGLVVPIVVGLLLGVAGVMGMLAGGLTAGFAVAIMMANSGGAWDNAKKYIESGAHGGKGTDVHKATVVGDTVGADVVGDTVGATVGALDVGETVGVDVVGDDDGETVFRYLERDYPVRLSRRFARINPRTGTVRLHTKLQCLQPLEKNPGIERAQARPAVAHEAEDVAANARGVTDDGPAQHAALTIDVLGGGVNDEVGAEGKRSVISPR